MGKGTGIFAKTYYTSRSERKKYLVRFLPEKPFMHGAKVLMEVTFTHSTFKNGLVLHNYKVDKIIKSDSIIFHPKCLFKVCKNEAKKIIKIYHGKKKKLNYLLKPNEEVNVFEAFCEEDALKYYEEHIKEFQWFGKEVI